MFRATFTPEGEKMEYFRLMTGQLIPAVGLGTWKSGPEARSIGHFAYEMEQAGHPKKGDMKGVWREMERLVSDGLVRDLGICNLTVTKLTKLLNFAHIKPSVCQVLKEPTPIPKEINPKTCFKANGDEVMAFNQQAYSPLGSGGDKRDLLNDPVVVRVARKLKKSPAQTLIKWALQRGTSVIPKSTNPDRIKENIQVFGWDIPEEDFNALSTIKEQKRILDGVIVFVNKKDGPFKSVEELWDFEDGPPITFAP
ncbi:hypothetical protein Cgig2_000537 [Carnegiea gigantea]|uniref:NADP-dependent oxidoreductase domain-containing protein n=1 Tax=Carnegiea gigantea TaxID=171969 RepID=A0A9Q1GSU3_9CARY|nr:hypothetical protein Cgig2_000537 [Carnegiea gigantea]